MPRQIQFEGRTIQVPDDFTDAEVQHVLSSGGQKPQPQQPSTPWTGASISAAPPESFRDRLTKLTPVRSDTLAHAFEDDLGNIGAGFLTPVLHPIKTLQGIGEMVPGEEFANSLAHGGSLSDAVKAQAAPYKSMASMVSGPDREQNAMGALGQTATMGATELTPDVLSTAGDTLRWGGRKAGNLTLGAPLSDASADAYGARPGAGISQNRIIATTRPSLARKVTAAVEPLAQREAEVLGNSGSPPINIRETINTPFNTLRQQVANPISGAAIPSQLRALTDTQRVLNFVQDPLTGKPATIEGEFGPTALPRNLESITPANAGEFKSNLYRMADYGTPDSTLAEQALKGAGKRLRDQIGEAVPESRPITQQLHDTLTARDILRNQTGGPTAVPAPGANSLFGAFRRYLADPALVTGGTTAATGLDLAGSGLNRMADFMRNIGGHEPTPVAGGSPRLAGGPAAPLQIGGGQTPLALPETAGMTRATPTASAPPNVTLTERVSRVNPKGNPITPGTGGLEGPPSRVTTRTRTGFGPKVEAPTFRIPPKLLDLVKSEQGSAKLPPIGQAIGKLREVISSSPEAQDSALNLIDHWMDTKGIVPTSQHSYSDISRQIYQQDPEVFSALMNGNWSEARALIFPRRHH